MASASSLARRDALYFAVGPALATVAAVAAFKVQPWPVPIRLRRSCYTPCR